MSDEVSRRAAASKEPVKKTLEETLEERRAQLEALKKDFDEKERQARIDARPEAVEKIDERSQEGPEAADLRGLSEDPYLRAAEETWLARRDALDEIEQGKEEPGAGDLSRPRAREKANLDPLTELAGLIQQKDPLAGMRRGNQQVRLPVADRDPFQHPATPGRDDRPAPHLDEESEEVESTGSFKRIVSVGSFVAAFVALLYLQGVSLGTTATLRIALAAVMGVSARILVELRP